MNIKQDMGDAQGGNSAKSGRNAFRNYLHREMIDNRGTVDGVATNI